MSLEIRKVTTKKDQKEFVNLQFDLYKGNTYWVPPIKKDELSIFTEDNPFEKFCDTEFWLAFKNGKCVGRIGAIINHKYNEKADEKNVRFSRLEFIDDREVVQTLLETAEKWGKEKGMTGIVGPLGYTNLDHQGMMIEGHDHLPSVASEYHLPYYKEHLEALGYDKLVDWIEFRLTLDEEVIEKGKKGAALLMRRTKTKIVSFKSNDELIEYADDIFNLLGESFKDLYSVISFDKEMVEYYKKKFLKLLSPKYVKVLLSEEDEEMLGFVIGMPSLSRALQKANGSIWPFGWYHIMQALKKNDTCDFLLTAVHPKLQRLGGGVMLVGELQRTMQENGIKYLETTGMFETNQKAIQNWKNYDHIQHKRKRCFTKAL
ncbi:GNAT family N-acetyltransferase [Flammeovirga sp. MY04]|uniref:GNAT family N-acetyltransferase n=1 Tax=Flammeovirga sp. MY04 TaxID=1191459 RepID=UPI0008062091|nr:GNAT family N-acetyltransferase [Flammeovirga sp. MY04]ANQ48138.1 GNAT family N-acetyltransferase [Flammeovirga sp. MY04]